MSGPENGVLCWWGKCGCLRVSAHRGRQRNHSPGHAGVLQRLKSEARHHRRLPSLVCRNGCLAWLLRAHSLQHSVLPSVVPEHGGSWVAAPPSGHTDGEQPRLECCHVPPRACTRKWRWWLGVRAR
eukprot:7264261-Prymnesium_polylepis.3